jgi:hypothetical protein
MNHVLQHIGPQIRRQTLRTSGARFLRRLLVVAAVALATLGAVGPIAAQELADQAPGFAVRLKSGLHSVAPGETVHVLLADVADVSQPTAATVRFIDGRNEVVSETQATLRPGQPVAAETSHLKLGGGPHVVVFFRIEIEFLSSVDGAEPTATVEWRGADDLKAERGFSCSDPLAKPGVQFACPEFRATDLLL